MLRRQRLWTLLWLPPRSTRLPWWRAKASMRKCRRGRNSTSSSCLNSAPLAAQFSRYSNRALSGRMLHAGSMSTTTRAAILEASFNSTTISSNSSNRRSAGRKAMSLVNSTRSWSKKTLLSSSVLPSTQRGASSRWARTPAHKAPWASTVTVSSCKQNKRLFASENENVLTMTARTVEVAQ